MDDGDTLPWIVIGIVLAPVVLIILWELTRRSAHLSSLNSGGGPGNRPQPTPLRASRNGGN